jgi:hypothetical protein
LPIPHAVVYFSCSSWNLGGHGDSPLDVVDEQVLLDSVLAGQSARIAEDLGTIVDHHIEDQRIEMPGRFGEVAP